jgi:hypothetical protein
MEQSMRNPAFLIIICIWTNSMWSRFKYIKFSELSDHEDSPPLFHKIRDGIIVIHQPQEHTHTHIYREMLMCALNEGVSEPIPQQAKYWVYAVSGLQDATDVWVGHVFFTPLRY